MGTLIAIAGAGLAAILCGIGSAVGVQMGGKAAAGVLSEKPELFGKLLLLQALPGTQGIYGFLTAILLASRIGLLGGGVPALDEATGWAFFGACMPIAIVGFISALYQGATAVSAIHMTAKQPDASVKGMTMTALVETYAILTLLISILLIFGIPV
ncbi:MAG: V-type ATP synthase subunit K [Bacilli bacterium]|jgi:V/A-type H+-transporting ATPase subunit K|nr:V-type ATP synthase subunit K [Bacilli bacterium]